MPNSDELRLPSKVTIQILDRDRQPLQQKDILFRITTRPRRKNEYRLGPYASNEAGIVTITQELLQAEIDATIESGIMDYNNIESSYPEVTISPYSKNHIERAIKGRTEAWRDLLRGEARRWTTIEELIDLYQRSENHRFKIPNEPEPPSSVEAIWAEPGGVYTYEVTLEESEA